MSLHALDYLDLNNRFDTIDDTKLARELGAHPRNFSKQKKQFSELMQWFEDSMIQDDAQEGMKIDSDSEKIKTLIRKMEAIEELYLLPLFAQNNPNVSGLAWNAFMHFYLTNYVQDNLHYRWNFLKTVTAENIYEKVIEERDRELRMILGVIFGGSLLEGKLGHENTLLLEGIAKLEEKYQTLKEKNQKKFDEAARRAWRKKGLLVTALFAGNIVSEKNPEHDIPYLDEFLCYHDSVFFSILMRDLVFENEILMQRWIAARSDLLANTTSEIYKLFCALFYLGEEGLFDDEGNILIEASLKIPDEFSEALGIVERKRKELVSREKSQQEKQMTEENTRKRVSDVLSQKIRGVCDENFVIGFQDIPPEISAIEIHISRNNKAHARTLIRSPFGESVDLKTCLFESFNPQRSEQSWNRIADWKGGENYQISLQGRIGTQKTLENELYQWREKKTETVKKESIALPILITPGKKVSDLLSAASTPVTTRISTPEPVRASLEATEAPKDPKESEKEDLHTALEFFLDKSDQELMSFFQEHTQWDTNTQILTLHIPVEELEDMGYTPSLLSVSEYGPMIQWSVKREKGKWVPEKDTAPEKIQAYYESIFRALSEQIERGEIDNYLSEIGLSPSETSDNSALKGAIRIQENIDIKKLLAGIKKMSEKYIQDGAHYNIYSGPLAKDGAPTSISWFSKKQWRATLTLQPEIKIDLTSTDNQALPYNASLLSQRIENALLNFMYQFIKNGKGISGIIKRTSAQEDTKRLRETYRRELKKKTARLLIENSDGTTFTIIDGVSSECLAETIGNAQKQYGVEKVALLYRRNTYTFLGDTSICKPSQDQSDDDYVSLALPERKHIIKERVLKTLFNGKSGVQDRAPFLYGSAVYHALQFEVQAFQEKSGKTLTREDITDEFLEKFIAILRSGQILISYRDYCAGEVEDLTDLVAQ